MSPHTAKRLSYMFNGYICEKISNFTVKYTKFDALNAKTAKVYREKAKHFISYTQSI